MTLKLFVVLDNDVDHAQSVRAEAASKKNNDSMGDRTSDRSSNDLLTHVRAALDSPEVPESAKRQLAQEHNLPYPPPKRRSSFMKRLRNELPDPGGCLLLFLFLAIAAGAALLGNLLAKVLM